MERRPSEVEDDDMRTISDLLKLVVHAKVVPDDRPNDDGRWITLDVSENRLRPRTDWDYLSSISPAGHHVVAVRE